jgi:hypothetical protein
MGRIERVFLLVFFVMPVGVIDILHGVLLGTSQQKHSSPRRLHKMRKLTDGWGCNRSLGV